MLIDDFVEAPSCLRNITLRFDLSNAFVDGRYVEFACVIILLLYPFLVIMVHSLGFPDLGTFFAAIHIIVNTALVFR